MLFRSEIANKQAQTQADLAHKQAQSHLASFQAAGKLSFDRNQQKIDALESVIKMRDDRRAHMVDRGTDLLKHQSGQHHDRMLEQLRAANKPAPMPPKGNK